MPYIVVEKRLKFMQLIEELAERVRIEHLEDGDRNGNMNYIISALIEEVYGDQWRYRDVNDVMGMLSSAQAEFYRKVAAPYEDQKEHENGAVY